MYCNVLRMYLYAKWQGYRGSHHEHAQQKTGVGGEQAWYDVKTKTRHFKIVANDTASQNPDSTTHPLTEGLKEKIKIQSVVFY